MAGFWDGNDDRLGEAWNWFWIGTWDKENEYEQRMLVIRMDGEK